jgi:hypothetical protein
MAANPLGGFEKRRELSNALAERREKMIGRPSGTLLASTPFSETEALNSFLSSRPAARHPTLGRG